MLEPGCCRMARKSSPGTPRTEDPPQRIRNRRRTRRRISGDVSVKFRIEDASPAFSLVLRSRESVLISRSFARCGAEFLSVHRHVARIRYAGTVLGLASFHIDEHADLQGRARPALPGETIRTAHFTTPVCDFSGLRILYVDVEIDMRIQPFDLRHNTAEIDGLRTVKFGCKRMVSEDRRSSNN